MRRCTKENCPCLKLSCQQPSCRSWRRHPHWQRRGHPRYCSLMRSRRLPPCRSTTANGTANGVARVAEDATIALRPVGATIARRVTIAATSIVRVTGRGVVASSSVRCGFAHSGSSAENQLLGTCGDACRSVPGGCFALPEGHISERRGRFTHLLAEAASVRRGRFVQKVTTATVLRYRRRQPGTSAGHLDFSRQIRSAEVNGFSRVSRGLGTSAKSAFTRNDATMLHRAMIT